MKYRVDTDINQDSIVQTLVENNITVIARWVCDVREKDFHKSLIKLGWTPPSNKEIMEDKMRIQEISNLPTVVNKDIVTNVHESELKSYNILKKVVYYLQNGVPGNIILELIDEMKGDPVEKEKEVKMNF